MKRWGQFCWSSGSIITKPLSDGACTAQPFITSRRNVATTSSYVGENGKAVHRMLEWLSLHWNHLMHFSMHISVMVDVWQRNGARGRRGSPLHSVTHTPNDGLSTKVRATMFSQRHAAVILFHETSCGALCLPSGKMDKLLSPYFVFSSSYKQSLRIRYTCCVLLYGDSRSACPPCYSQNVAYLCA